MIFTIDGIELAKLKQWLDKRPKKKAYTGAIGGRYSYSFFPTGVGTIIKVKDGVTGDEIDVTDYDGW